jgi:hypothetical protein
MKRSLIVLCMVAVLVLATTTTQAALLVDRGLPTTNLNNAASANRSNVSWSFIPGNTYFSGDDFQLPISPFGQWRIDTVTIWGTAGTPGDTAFHLADRYSQITLYGGLATDGVISIASGTFVPGTNATNNPNISIMPVNYTNVTEPNYQGSSGSYVQMWQVDFNNLNWIVDGNVLYQFGVHGLTGDSSNNWFNHASNATLGGVEADGADDLYRWFDVTNLAQLDPPVTGSHYDNTLSSLGYGWDKSSDINVLVYGEAIPEPTTFIIWSVLGLSAVGFGYWRRKRAV